MILSNTESHLYQLLAVVLGDLSNTIEAVPVDLDLIND